MAHTDLSFKSKQNKKLPAAKQQICRVFKRFLEYVYKIPKIIICCDYACSYHALDSKILTTNRLTLGADFFSLGCSDLRDSNLARRDLVDSILSCSDSSMLMALFTDCFSGSQCSNFSFRDLARAAFCACTQV